MNSRMQRPDADGRYPLSEREYYALRELFGIVNTFSEKAGELEPRAKLQPGVWRDLRMIQSVAAKAMAALLRTVPARKLIQINRELANTQVLVNVNRSICEKPDQNDDNLTYVSQRALERITQIAVNSECLFCEKQGADARHCQLRKDIESTYMFDTGSSKTECQYAGMIFSERSRDEDSIQAEDD